MRSFIAVDVSESVLAEIENLVTSWKSRLRGARWVRSGNHHLTLRFLGETSEATLEHLSDSMATIAAESAPFRLSFDGVGYFPSARRPRIFWVGVTDPPAALLDLQRRIETEIRRQGFEPEKRRFTPHLTVARFRGACPDPECEQLAREYENHSFGFSNIKDVIVYQSVLKPEGAEYSELRRLRLGAS
jgi:2'-5' RNA ligase